MIQGLAVKNNKGFSIVEVLVAAALMGALALAISKLTQDQLKSTRTVETRFEYNAILNGIREILGDRQSCKETFQGRNAETLAAGTVDRIKSYKPTIPSPTIVDKYLANLNYDLAPQYGAGGTIRILSYRLAAMGGLPGGSNIGTTNLYVKFAFGPDKTYSSSTIERKITLEVQTVSAANRNIVECNSTGAIADYDARYVDVSGDYMDGPLEIRSGSGITMRNGTNITLDSGSEMIVAGTAQIRFTSDKRLKEEIKNSKPTLAKISKLRPVNYRWKDSEDRDHGLIAQEVQKVYPELVHKDEQGYLSVNYIMLTPLLIKSVQELNQENRTLKKNRTQLKEEQTKINVMLNEMRNNFCAENPQSASCK